MTTVGFSTREKNVLSRMIRWFTKSSYSHCWVRYWHPIYKMDLVIEAGTFGIVELPYEHVIRENQPNIELVPPAAVDIAVGMPALGTTLGAKYDYPSLVGRIAVIVARWFGKKIKNPLGSPKQDCCVENVIRCLAQADPRLAVLDPEVESPESLYDRLIEMGWTQLPR